MKNKITPTFITTLLLAAGHIVACGQTPEDARLKLGQMNIPYTEEEFMKSAGKGDRLVVELFITAGIDVNAEQQRHGLFSGLNITALNSAAGNGHLEVVKTLIKNGADVKLDSLALMEAAGNGHLEVVKTLIENAADVNHLSFLLKRAAVEDSVDLAKRVLDYGVDINATDEDGGTALMSAAAQPHINFVKFLLDRGAAVTIKDGAGKTALDFATQNHDLYSGYIERTKAQNRKPSSDWFKYVEEYRTIIDLLEAEKKTN